MSVAFEVDKFREAKKEFRGVIVNADYGENPLGMKGRPDIVTRTQLVIEIDTEEYDKHQFEWFPPSDKKLTKWWYFVNALAKCGAMRDIKIEGKTDEEKLQSMAQSLIGMEFRFVELGGLEMMVKDRTLEILLPDEYFGKKAVSPATPIKTETVSEEPKID